MASLRDIRKRIKSVKSTRQITRAVKMVAAAKLRRAQDAIIAARPYASTLDKMIAEVMSRAEGGNVAHPLLARREVKKVEVLVLTSDRGLAGGFNSNVNRRALKFLTESGSKYEVTITTIGRKGGDFFRARGFKMRKDYPGMMNKVTYQGAADVADELANRFLKGEIDAVYLANNEFVSAISQRINFSQLLPFEAAAPSAAGAAKTDYIYEPNPQAVLDQLVPQALKIKIFRALLDSVASEHGARMTAMENATKNAGEMIGKL
ncbi:MAG: synthase subunit gamma, partial [Myxococcaceae bacterium]|nr:synthase subunit gamma [Myxococcaceae bacterium]